MAHTAPERVGGHRAVLEDPGATRLVCAVVGREIAIKHGLGRLQLPAPPATWVPGMLRIGAMTPLPIGMGQVLAVADRPDHPP